MTHMYLYTASFHLCEHQNARISLYNLCLQIGLYVTRRHRLHRIRRGVDNTNETRDSIVARW